jgi:hypothetical protein
MTTTELEARVTRLERIVRALRAVFHSRYYRELMAARGELDKALDTNPPCPR